MQSFHFSVNLILPCYLSLSMLASAGWNLLSGTVLESPSGSLTDTFYDCCILAVGGVLFSSCPTSVHDLSCFHVWLYTDIMLVQFPTLVQLGTKMDWLDLAVKRSKVRVATRPMHFSIGSIPIKRFTVVDHLVSVVLKLAYLSNRQ